MGEREDSERESEGGEERMSGESSTLSRARARERERRVRKIFLLAPLRRESEGERGKEKRREGERKSLERGGTGRERRGE